MLDDTVIQLVDGSYFNPFTREGLANVSIECIAHALSMQCRYAGHCAYHYSVAQHSVYVHDAIAREYPDDVQLRKASLLHDVDEAFGIPDMPRLLKYHPTMTAYRESQAAILKDFFALHDLAWPIDARIHLADNCVLLTEWKALRRPGYVSHKLGDAKPLDWLDVGRWSPEGAKHEFLGVWRFLEHAS